MSQDIKKPVFGNAAAPEFVRVNGKLQVRDGIRVGFTRCFTCNNMCGLRYRVDEKQIRSREWPATRTARWSPAANLCL